MTETTASAEIDVAEPENPDDVVNEPGSVESGYIDAIGESVADWANAVPFTAEHDRLLRECHAGLTQIASFIDSVPNMIKDSPFAAMLGMEQE